MIGSAYIPFTFPTATVRRLMAPSVPSVSDSDVDRIWDIYQAANLDGDIPAYNRDGGLEARAGNARVISYLASKGISRMMAAAWLNATAEAAGFWGYRWIDPHTSREAVADAGRVLGDIVVSSGKVLGDAAGGAVGPVLGYVKWVALGAGFVAIAYILYQTGALRGVLGKGKK